jgi:hypothetical protein
MLVESLASNGWLCYGLTAALDKEAEIACCICWKNIWHFSRVEDKSSTSILELCQIGRGLVIFRSWHEDAAIKGAVVSRSYESWAETEVMRKLMNYQNCSSVDEETWKGMIVWLKHSSWMYSVTRQIGFLFSNPTTVCRHQRGKMIEPKP